MSHRSSLTLFDLDETLLPLDSDHAWGEFVVRLGWVDEADFRPDELKLYPCSLIETAELMRGIGQAAKAASRRLAIATPEEKNAALIAAAKALRAATPKILAANAQDIEAAKAAGRPAAFVDRLLAQERVTEVAPGRYQRRN